MLSPRSQRPILAVTSAKCSSMLAAAAGGGAACLTGSETLADLAMARGAGGIVPGLGNVDPHGYVRLYEAARAGDTGAARAEQRRLTELFAIIDREANTLATPQNKLNCCPLRFGLAKWSVVSLERRLLRPSFSQAISKRRPIIQAIGPVPFIRVPHCES